MLIYKNTPLSNKHFNLLGHFVGLPVSSCPTLGPKIVPNIFLELLWHKFQAYQSFFGIHTLSGGRFICENFANYKKEKTSLTVILKCSKGGSTFVGTTIMAVLYSELCGELEDVREAFKFLTILRIYPSLLQGPWDRMTIS